MGAARDYVRSLLKQGYSEEAIRQILERAGYSEQQIRGAFHSKHLLVLSASILGIVILGVVAFFLVPALFSEAATLSLDARILSVSSDAVSVNVELSSNSEKRIETKVSMVLVDSSGKSVLSRQQSASFVSSTTLPASFSVASLRPGKYVLHASTVFKNSKIARAIPLIIPERKTASPVALQPVEQAEECLGGCNDFNACTIDSCAKGKCINSPRLPCCGNRQCEADESPVSCPSDCVQAKRKSYAEIIEDAEVLASSDADSAADMCASLLVVPQSDLCFSRVARVAEKSIYCKPIQTVPNRDDCFAQFAQKEPDACNNIFDEYLRNACHALAQYSSNET